GYTISASDPCLTISPATGQAVSETDTITVSLDRSSLTPGTHNLTITINGGVGGVEQISVSLQVLATTDVTFVQDGDAWTYFKATAAPAAGWNTTGFSDAGWLSGPGGIGYSTDITYNTTLTDMIGSYLAFYGRSPFTISNPQAVQSMTLGLTYDDAFVAYINGVEVARSASMGGTPGTPPAYNVAANGSHDEELPEEFFDFEISSLQNALVCGENVLAIKVHNVMLTSSDAGFVPRLEATLLTDAYQCDLNCDGVVDIFDWMIFQPNYGLATPTLEQGDLNSDGVVDIFDWMIFQPNFGLATAALEQGDLNDDGVVNIFDWMIFQSNFGLAAPTPEQGDINDDGVVDIFDWMIFQTHYGVNSPITTAGDAATVPEMVTQTADLEPGGCTYAAIATEAARMAVGIDLPADLQHRVSRSSVVPWPTQAKRHGKRQGRKVGNRYVELLAVSSLRPIRRFNTE
ncbi:MAG: hypothetical protein HQ546_10020, partial [Planctomycetes bacterium]|nr:hypothetical protein [Planctomycetota bacterium]